MVNGQKRYVTFKTVMADTVEEENVNVSSLSDLSLA